jgi:hypothetical protein
VSISLLLLLLLLLPPGDVEALQLLAAAVEDSSIERLTAVNWQARDRWGDTPLQVLLYGSSNRAAAAQQQDIC